jgi:phosphoglycerate dehydrogenase-like enzyme
MEQREKIRILFLWEVDDTLQHYFRSRLSSKLDFIDLIFINPYLEEKALEYIEQVDMIIGWRPKKEILTRAKKTRLFQNPGAGVQHLILMFKEINKSREQPLLLANCHGNAYFTAQHTVAMLLSFLNRIPLYHDLFRSGAWRSPDLKAPSRPLRHTMIGLLGYGAINKYVHKFLAGFDVKFSILKRKWGSEKDNLEGVIKYEPESLHEFLQNIDILIIAVPLTKMTKGLIKEKELKLLGKNGVIVNVGRGVIVEETALYSALKNNDIAGACIDVWYNYSPEPDEKGRKYPYSSETPFHELNNIILSPHRGASPMTDLARWDDVIYNIELLSCGKYSFKNLVNLENEY